jgi:ATP-dependent Clp endopeptidase proteolytic subunit ClpP
MTDAVELMCFSMRTEKPPKGADWFRIVEAKKGSDITKVYIYDEIGFWGTNAKEFAAALDDIDTKEIHLHVNSPGGSVFDGLAIYNTLKNHSAKVTGIVDGMAASTASFILQAADVRQISRNAQVMIHDAKAFAGGNAAQMRQAADLLDKISNEIADIYAVNAGKGEGKSAEDFRDIMKAGDHWYNGNEALDAGLVDEVTDNPDEDEDEDAPEEATKNIWKATDVEAFLSASPAKLAATASHPMTMNRVEEAQMGDKPTTTTPPPAAQPPAPVATAEKPLLAPEPFKFMVNGVEVTDPAAVQAHMTGLELYKKESIESGRKAFVDSLASDGKILASQINDTSEFALSLDSDQFDKWKATMVAAPKSSLFENHGTDSEQQTPKDEAKAATAQRITVLNEIVQGHRDSGMSDEQIKNLESFKELEKLTATSEKDS